MLFGGSLFLQEGITSLSRVLIMTNIISSHGNVSVDQIERLTSLARSPAYMIAVGLFIMLTGVILAIVSEVEKRKTREESDLAPTNTEEETPP